MNIGNRKRIANNKIAAYSVLLVLSIVVFLIAIIYADKEILVPVSGYTYQSSLDAICQSLKSIVDFSFGLLWAIILLSVAGIIFSAIMLSASANEKRSIVEEEANGQLVEVHRTIACPKCKGQINIETSAETLVCPVCRTEYKNPHYKG